MRHLSILLALLVLGGCTSLSYYAQSVRGQLGVMAASRPVDDVIADPATDAAVRERLRELPALRRFAVSALNLPETDSYSLYASVEGEALVWSVVATPFDSLTSREWCYPFVGCASYRGYFRRQDAQAYADTLLADGWDVAVEPVPAYSTLGWFSDPLPSTVIEWPIADIGGLVFHELAHEALYVAGDSSFNEGYATLVEREGVRRWLDRHGSPRQRSERSQREARREAFLRLLADTRARLVQLYDEPIGRDELSGRKQSVFQGLRADYAVLRESWGGYAGYDQWFERPLNNAHLAGVGTYYTLEPAFRRILAGAGGDMQAFNRACQAIAAMPPAQRRAYMHGLLEPPGLSVD